MALKTLPADKANHFVYGAVIFAVAYALFSFAQLPALALASAVVAFFAIGKEVWDYKHKESHTPDPWDAVATIMGGVVCAVPAVICGM